MTKKEAYELLDLPQDSNLTLIRKHFSEQYNEYRMQIDNAPTPNLRQRYEHNLALREEAFHLLTGNNNLDDTADLPNVGRVNFSEDRNEEKKPDPVKEEKNEVEKKIIPSEKRSLTLDLSTAIATLGVKEGDSTVNIKAVYIAQKRKLSAGIGNAKTEGLMQAFEQELAKLERSWIVIEDWLNKRIEPIPLEQEGLYQEKKSYLIPIIFTVLALIVVACWVLDETEVETAFINDIKIADSLFASNNLDQAVERYKEALQKKPGDPVVMKRLMTTEDKIESEKIRKIKKAQARKERLSKRRLLER